MAGAVGALRVPRVAGVAGIKACSLRRPSDVRSGGASPRDSQDLKSKCWEASSKHWEALLWTHEIRRNFFFESLVKERPSPRFALRGRRLEANRRNMRQRVAVCHIPQAQQQPISLKHTRLRHRTREPEECVPWLIGQALSGAAAGRTRVAGAGRGVASVLVPLEPGRVVAASPLARQRHAGLGSGVLRTRLLAGGKQRLIDWLIK